MRLTLSKRMKLRRFVLTAIIIAHIILFNAYQVTSGSEIVEPIDEKLIMPKFAYLVIQDIAISPDGNKIAFSINTTEKEQLLFENKNPIAKHDSIHAITYSPNGKHLAYLAYEGNNQQLILDNRTVKKFKIKEHLDIESGKNIIEQLFKKNKLSYECIEGDPQFSPNSKRLAYVVHKYNNMENVFVDDVELKPFNIIINESIIFSPDSKHIAYAAVSYDSTDIPKIKIILDSLEVSRYPLFTSVDKVELFLNGDIDYYNLADFKDLTMLSDITFSSDSKKLAYKVSQAGKEFFIIDGKQEPSYDKVYTLKFSLDNMHYAYAAVDGKKSFIIRDGIKGKIYDQVYPPVFSKDSQHIYYFAKQEKKYFLVKDQEELNQCDGFTHFYPILSQ
ncbi:MAG: PD40 domain-containing protein, partial [bacterium]